VASAIEIEIDELRRLAGSMASLARQRPSHAEGADLAAWENLARLATEISERLIEIGQRIDDQNHRRTVAEERAHKSDDRVRALDARLHEAERWASLGKRAAEIGAVVRNSLAIIGARRHILELAVQRGELSRLAASFHVIDGEIDRAQENLVELLDLSREAPRLAPLDLNQVVRTTVDFAASLSRFENIRFVPRLEEGLPPVAIDVGQLQQVLMNLFSNSADAMGRRKGEGGRIWVTTTHLADASAVEVSVRDEGPGVPQTLIERVFEPGFSTRDGRLGTGLTVAREIAIAHGGSLILAAPLDGRAGAHFQLRIPLA
jgi:signal transduction histidine kinase